MNQTKTNHIDGWLYVGLGICAALLAILDTTDAGKYIGEPALFYIKAYASIFNAALLAGKMYRSTNFAQAQQDKATTIDADRTNERDTQLNNPPPAANKITLLLLLCTLAGLGLSQTGCTLVSANRVFPKPAWYWSDAAQEQRRENAAEKKYDQTNQPPKP